MTYMRHDYIGHAHGGQNSMQDGSHSLVVSSVGSPPIPVGEYTFEKAGAFVQVAAVYIYIVSLSI